MGIECNVASWSRKESEVFGWCHRPKNTRSQTQDFLSDSESPIESFLHCAPKLEILTLTG